jgi:hypothetical protein
MLASMPGDEATTPLHMACAECESAIAHDQRYCVECGARKGPLPAAVAGTIAGIFEQGSSAAPTLPGAGVAADSAEDDARIPVLGDWFPSPRATAAAVFAVLGFGAVVGSFVGASPASLFSGPQVIVAVSPAPAPPASTSVSSGGNGGSSNGGGGNSGGGSPATPASSPTPGAPASTTTTATTTTTPTTPSLPYPPPIKHVFLIVLSDQGYAQTFGSTDKYFSKSLPKQGELIPQYYAVTSGELANGVALISGQGPTAQTAGDCPIYSDFTATGAGKLKQVLGSGCVYPKTTSTLADQLAAKNRGGWKAYIEDSDPVPTGQPKTCRHPALNAVDGNWAPPATDRYLTWRNPFVYFHSLIDAKSCAHRDVSMTQLATDLAKESTTPALSYIIPSPCQDGASAPCAPGAPAGLPPAEAFLRTVVPEIEQSPAYKADGMIAITFDQAPQAGPTPDTGSCCDAQIFPNAPAAAAAPAAGTTPTTTTPATPTTPTTTTPAPTTILGITVPTLLPPASTTPATATTTPSTTTPASTTTTTTTPTTTTTTPTPTGGGQVGLLVISKYVKAGCVDNFDQFNHFGLLGTIEQLLKLPLLGYASDPSLPKFALGVFNTSKPVGQC